MPVLCFFRQFGIRPAPAVFGAGIAAAHFNSGILNKYGRGIRVNFAQSRARYTKAFEQGGPLDQYLKKGEKK